MRGNFQPDVRGNSPDKGNRSVRDPQPTDLRGSMPEMRGNSGGGNSRGGNSKEPDVRCNSGFNDLRGNSREQSVQSDSLSASIPALGNKGKRRDMVYIGLYNFIC
jgi:hypothetical protein